ncbi:DUF6183 family protein [Streptomyces sp. GESEQ-35]|uniref:DUF6183 family protein n=1 Tax=Streptomyces sp. GESEQ-35 TaxID=2812657 RepID=UPI001B31A883|nr:DUF6183 family protein [Streptomyces sp. GESEQ-35]
MTDRTAQILSQLPRKKNVTPVNEEADARLAAGDATFVGDLGVALMKEHAADSGVWQYRGVFDHLLQLLATTPGDGHIEQALRLVTAAASVVPKRHTRYAASLLASCKEPEELVRVFAGGQVGAPEELRACLVQELVLRGVAIEELPEVARWVRSPHGSHHPLRRLPLSLSVLEHGPPLPGYSINGSSASLPYGDRGTPVRPHGRTTVPAVTETTSEPTASAIGAAAANWAAESNGRIEARTFESAEAVDAAAVPGLLRAVDLECLRGAGAGKGVAVSSWGPGRAWEVLFAAASSGGAYNHGEFGAYGRLAAWRSVAGLVGVAEDAPFDVVERRAQDVQWYGFGTDTPWFENVAWDIALVAVDAGRRVAVLAATDTD